MADVAELTGKLNDMSRGFQQAAVLFTAVEADVFAHFASGPKTAPEIANALGWDPRSTRIFLDALTALDILEKSGEQYANTALAEMCLVPGSPAYQGNIIKHQRSGYLSWLHMDEALRTGRAVTQDEDGQTPEDRRNVAPDELRNFILGMSDIGHMSAAEILEAVDLSPYRRLLDVGGGPGTYGIAFLGRHEQMRATLFDRPEVVAIAKEQVRLAGLVDHFDYAPGDFMLDPLGEGYDLVLLSNIIHSYSPENNRKLVKKCFGALEPGGLLILKDFIVEEGRSGPPFSLLFALHMLIHTGEGDTYTYEEVASWTDAAGFAPGRAVDITPQSRLWLAEKPGAAR